VCVRVCVCVIIIGFRGTVGAVDRRASNKT